MSLNQQVIAEFSPCTPCAPQLRDLSIQTFLLSQWGQTTPSIHRKEATNSMHTSTSEKYRITSIRLFGMSWFAH